MQKVIRSFCCLRVRFQFFRPDFPVWHAMLLGLALAGCGGNEGASSQTSSAPASTSSLQSNQSAPASMTAQSPMPEPAVPASSPSGKHAVDSAEEAARLERLAALPLLSSLSDGEKAGLLKQLPSASPSQRFSLLNRYPSLAALPERQRQVLLDQLEKIVPLNIPENKLVCHCSDDIKREVSVKESCSNQAELQSICNRTCGTLAAFKNICIASQQGAEK